MVEKANRRVAMRRTSLALVIASTLTIVIIDRFGSKGPATLFGILAAAVVLAVFCIIFIRLELRRQREEEAGNPT